MQKAKVCKAQTPCVPRTFRQALACRTQHHPMLTLEEIADRAEVQARRLYRWANDNEPHEQIPMQALMRICAVTGAWDLIDFMLEPHGLRVMSIGRTQARDLLHEAVDLPVAVGRTLDLVQRVTQDGRVDEDEEREVRQSLRELRRHADDVDNALDFHTARRA